MRRTGYGSESTGELPGSRHATVGADKNYGTQGFVNICRGMKVTLLVACNDRRRGGAAIDRRTSRHTGYAASMKVRKRIEEGFGWGKTVGSTCQIKVRGLDRVNAIYRLESDTNIEFSGGVCQIDRETQNESGKIGSPVSELEENYHFILFSKE